MELAKIIGAEFIKNPYVIQVTVCNPTKRNEIVETPLISFVFHDLITCGINIPIASKDAVYPTISAIIK